jgi:hypothetical protein
MNISTGNAGLTGKTEKIQRQRQIVALILDPVVPVFPVEILPISYS